MLIPALFVADAVRSREPASSNRYDVIIFSQASEVTDTHLDWMRRRGIIFRDDMDMSRFQDVKLVSERLTSATLMKLLLAEHLSGEYERLLYLDSDLTIHGDVGRIFSLDTGPFQIAATPSGRILVQLTEQKRRETLDHFKALGMTEPYRFFNTGVLYIDVAKWNAARLGERALAYLKQNPRLCFLPDEHALNAVLDGHIAELTPVWNMRPITKERPFAHELVQPAIVHHAGHDKPWRRYGYRKRLFPDRSAYRLYENFLKDTPWPDWLDRQWSASDLMASIRWELKRLSRRLRGQPEQPSEAQHEVQAEEIRHYLAEAKFADVEQGIVVWSEGRFRLAGAVS